MPKIIKIKVPLRNALSLDKTLETDRNKRKKILIGRIKSARGWIVYRKPDKKANNKAEYQDFFFTRTPTLAMKNA
ncbi:MAG: hypothetical protein R6T98_11960 [Desulfatiglandales bacterium]